MVHELLPRIFICSQNEHRVNFFNTLKGIHCFPKLKVEYLLEHLEQVQIFPDKVIVIVPILSEGIVVEKTQYVSREKRCWQINNDEYDNRISRCDKRRD